MLHNILIILLALLALLLTIRCWNLAIDPNYGCLSAAGGLWRLRRNRRRRTIVLLDIDDFKAFNGKHGHSAADKRMRQALRFRRVDRIQVVKRGGDEIVLSTDRLPASELAFYAADRLRAQGLTATMVGSDDVRDYDAFAREAEVQLLALKQTGNKNSLLVQRGANSELIAFSTRSHRS